MGISNLPLATAQQIKSDIDKLDNLIKSHLVSSCAFIQEICSYILNNHGKRIRPLIVIYTAKAAGYSGQDHIKLAAAIELIHIATLLHDDVIDGSKLRRNKHTTNNIWGNKATILVGDFLYGKAFELLVTLNNQEIMNIVAFATTTIVTGEINQMLQEKNPHLTETEYLEIIEHKTAKLFETAAHAGVALAHADHASKNAFIQYGRNIGIAYQLIDDVMDYLSEPAKLGKDLGDDLAQGRPTLPLIYLMQHCNSTTTKNLITAALLTGNKTALKQIQTLLQNSNAIEYTISLAKDLILKALDAISVLPGSVYLHAARNIADLVLARIDLLAKSSKIGV